MVVGSKLGVTHPNRSSFHLLIEILSSHVRGRCDVKRSSDGDAERHISEATCSDNRPLS